MKTAALCTFSLIFAALGFTAEKSTPDSKQKEVIVILGDSLTEGYGISKEKAFPRLVEEKLQALGKNVEVINGGISGSTTASGPSRLKWFMKRHPNRVVLALGANDGLRGTPIEETRANLEKMVILAREGGSEVILAGMKLPPNYGAKQAKAFSNIFIVLEKKYHLKSLPFLLEGVAGIRELNQEDGVHPNEKGHRIIADHLFEVLK